MGVSVFALVLLYASFLGIYRCVRSVARCGCTTSKYVLVGLPETDYVDHRLLRGMQCTDLFASLSHGRLGDFDWEHRGIVFAGICNRTDNAAIIVSHRVVRCLIGWLSHVLGALCGVCRIRIGGTATDA